MDIHQFRIFMCDDALCHRFRILFDFLKNQKVEMLQWPGNCPDLNTIKNLLKILKDKVAKKQPSSAKQLVDEIKKKFGSLK